MWASPVSPYVEIGGIKSINPTVNLAYCITIIGYIDDKFYIEEDPGKRIEIPAIEFRGCDVKWFFKTEKERDGELARLYQSLELEC